MVVRSIGPVLVIGSLVSAPAHGDDEPLQQRALFLIEHRRASALSTTCARGSKPGHGVLTDQVAALFGAGVGYALGRSAT